MSEDFHKSMIQYTFKEAPQVKIPSFVGQQNCERLESNMYESPIKVIQKMMDEITEQREKAVMTKVTETLGFEIDKEELVKALNYDRNQYNIGFLDAKKQYEPKWIPVSERPPKELTPVNITWVNRNPESYHNNIKDKPFSATGVYYKGKWYWYSPTCEDYLAEYGRNEVDRIDADIEVTAWMPIAEPYKENEE